MLGGDRANGVEDAGAHVLVGLSVVPAGSALTPEAELCGKPRLAFLPGQPAPGAHVHLAKRGKPDDGQAARLRDGLGCLPGAPKVARVHRFQPNVHEPAGELLCLAPALLGERAVCMPLPAPLDVPVALAVAREVDRRHLPKACRWLTGVIVGAR